MIVTLLEILGMPRFNVRNSSRKLRFSHPNSAMSEHVSPPLSTEHSAIGSISSST